MWQIAQAPESSSAELLTPWEVVHTECSAQTRQIVERCCPALSEITDLLWRSPSQKGGTWMRWTESPEAVRGLRRLLAYFEELHQRVAQAENSATHWHRMGHDMQIKLHRAYAAEAAAREAARAAEAKSSALAAELASTQHLWSQVRAVGAGLDATVAASHIREKDHVLMRGQWDKDVQGLWKDAFQSGVAQVQEHLHKALTEEAKARSDREKLEQQVDRLNLKLKAVTADLERTTGELYGARGRISEELKRQGKSSELIQELKSLPKFEAEREVKVVSPQLSPWITHGSIEGLSRPLGTHERSSSPLRLVALSNSCGPAVSAK
eukprot:gnl/MRDRNA2_/MRDRNA2_110611_c0_seq1.p1 gnl/MRDRNA2_/MRDRNA2_110611_c0~~gnl/MRDRNA2_/MRDRNA2_110611_c0_seq1.p1  ORF type:complete len:324 (+),score=79.36 gnl/MRDRNA2_/MRDRNA2_110611_c0_seq1:89-1060(+)